MESLLNTENYSILRDKSNSTLFTIKFQSPNPSLIQSLTKTKIITGSLVSSDNQSIKFKSSKIQSFKEFQEELHKKNGTNKISILLAVKLFTDLANQLNYLIHKCNQCFLGYHIDNIIVIDENKFVYLSSDYLSNIDNNNNIIHTFPFSQNDFNLSPEQLKIKELPSFVPYTSAYYSLASLIIFSLYSISEENVEDDNPLNPNLIQDKLEKLPIKETKIYWFLKKCILENPLERRILYI